MTLSQSSPGRVLAGRIGGLTTASRNDPMAYTSAARAAFADSFAREVDPEGVLPPGERDRRAMAAKKAHMVRLALRSSQVRAQRRQRAGG